MTPEVHRFDWTNLRTDFDGPIDVPKMINELANAKSESIAEQAYIQLGSTVVNQNEVYSSALPTAVCLLTSLYTCTPVSRLYILLMLSEIAYGSTYDDVNDKERDQIIYSGLSYYVYLLGHAKLGEELGVCLDLVSYCTGQNEALKPRLRWIVSEYFTNDQVSSEQKAYALRQLDEFGIAHPETKS